MFLIWTLGTQNKNTVTRSDLKVETFVSKSITVYAEVECMHTIFIKGSVKAVESKDLIY